MKFPSISKNRWFWHLLYWIISLVFLVYFLGYQTIGVRLTLWFILTLAPIVILTTYFFTEFLIPRFLVKKRIFKFSVYAVYTVIASVYLELIMLVVIFIFGAGLNIRAANFNASFLVAGTYIPIVVGIAVKLYRTWQQSEESNLRLLQQKTEQELQLLKTQIHPHFLFNTLNNLYTLIHEKSEKAGDVVLQLSNLLSFILYDCKSDRILLTSEIKQIENYIALEKLRYGHRVEVDILIRDKIDHVSVLPLTLLPLIENCFKHGVKPTLSRSTIIIEISMDNNCLVMHIKNTLPAKVSHEDQGGLGLSNLRSRLHLAYADNFEISTDRSPDFFTVLLKIPANETD
ncbi:MAG: histidine kinase [Cyclobacteriaceae bacterium]|nr:histidine kinase [Cyclobacteriaceae bacterium]